MSGTTYGRNKGGAPKGNTNALRHGLRSSQLPKDCRYIELAVNKFRRQVETAVVEASQGTNVVQAALIHSACRHERRAQLAERWLRLNAELPLNERLGLLKTISDATDSRDRCLERLRLDVTPVDPWQAAMAVQSGPISAAGQLANENPASDVEDSTPSHREAVKGSEQADYRIREPAHH